MDEREQRINKKNPAVAAILSVFFPGAGFFYLGDVVKGIAYIMMIITVIVLEVHAEGLDQIIVFALMIPGFYIWQIFDSYLEAKRISTNQKEKKPSIFSPIVIIFIGILFQLVNLDIIYYYDFAKFWPMILIVIGMKYIFSYLKNRELKEGE
jgi:TM2 domain-containing membrane protein YozV